MSLLIAAAPGIAAAEDAPEPEPKTKESAAETAQRLANPADQPANMTFNFDFVEYQGNLPDAGGQRGWSLSAQPVIPVPVAGGRKVFIRPLIPILFQTAHLRCEYR
jgi:hypothetical protein